MLAFIPTGIIGFILKNKVDEWLGSVHIVAYSLIIGGILLILSDSYFKLKTRVHKNLDQMSIKDSISFGIFQSIAMISDHT